MHEPIESYCRTGTVHFMLFPQCAEGNGPLVETFLQLASDVDLDVIEVGHVGDPAVRRDMAAIARAARVDVVVAAHPRLLAERLDPAALTGPDRQKALAALVAELDAAAELGASSFSLLSGFDPGEAARPQAISQLIKTLGEVCDQAAQRHMQVLLEPFHHDGDRKALVGPTATAVEVHRQVGRRNFGLLLDLSHMAMQGERPVRALPLARECVRHVHVGNCVLASGTRYAEQHPPFGCTDGVTNVPQLAEFLRVLLDIGFFNTRSRPVMSFEIGPAGPLGPQLALAGAKRSVRTAWLEV